MVFLLAFAFISGLITILTPCIWPLLPIVLSSSISGKSHKRPLGVTLGIMVSFAFFTLVITSIVRIFHIDPNILRLLAVIVIGILGLTLLIPSLSQKLEGLISRLTGYMGGNRNLSKNDFSTGFIAGLSLGLVWSPCAGPILAAIATLASTGKVTLDVILITIFYVLGIGIPLFIFAYLGQRIFTKTKFISKYTGRVQQVFGVVMILTALAIYTNYDVYLQSKFLNAFPQFNSTLTNFGNNPELTKQLDVLKGTKTIQNNDNLLLNTNSKAPDFIGITKWLNTEKPLTLKDLKGKVVLVDFWTYTCINCIRTLPFVTSWYEKYKNDGFVVIGIHTPEFQFEHETQNVLNAIKTYNINYPVAQDNDFATWNNYNNQYWPAEYLIDANGNIRRFHFGEGEYDKMEQAIQALLKEAGKSINTKLLEMPDQTPKTELSPETYLGASRMQYYYPSANTGVIEKEFKLSENIPPNYFSLGGKWNIGSEESITISNSSLNFNFFADKIYLVIRPSSGLVSKVKVFIDGKLVNSSNEGKDVKNGEIRVDTDRLYNLIDLKGKPGSHLLKLEFLTPGTQVFAFTFG